MVLYVKLCMWEYDLLNTHTTCYHKPFHCFCSYQLVFDIYCKLLMQDQLAWGQKPCVSQKHHVQPKDTTSQHVHCHGKEQSLGKKHLPKSALAASRDSKNFCLKSAYQYSQHWGTATCQRLISFHFHKKICGNATNFSKASGLYYSTVR